MSDEVKIFSLSLFQSLAMAEYEELAASAGYDSDDSDGADTDEEVKNPFIILLMEWGWCRELDLTLQGEGIMFNVCLF